ncbi:MAG: hypothetical protein HWQ43_14985 [Nostoc sp. JL31]|nr:hypothetical protein [Nostoc sp. JL31]MBN3890406.1 hypothetical protein [Nostoc sp. JL31]
MFHRWKQPKTLKFLRYHAGSDIHPSLTNEAVVVDDILIRMAIAPN